MTDYKPKLIEVALPLAVINKEAAREKSIRHGHPSTLHLWWARRPLAAARAVIWASLVDDPSGDTSLSPEEQETERARLFGILERLVVWENSNDPNVLADARAEIDRCFPDGPPPVLDPFGGGGTIPLEAQRLGLTALSGDLNPVAVLIQRAMIEIPPRFAGRPPVHPDVEKELSTWQRAQGLAADIEAYGRWMSDEARRRIGHLYPDATGPNGEPLTPIAWIWVRTVESPDPTWRGHVPLTPTWVLRNKPGKPIVWVEPVVDSERQHIDYLIREGGTPGPQTMNRGKGTCLATGAAITGEYIKAQGMAGLMKNRLIAIAADGGRRRVYCRPTEDDERLALSEFEGWKPPGEMSTHPQYMGTPRYGLNAWSDLFLPRQLAALSTLSSLLPEIRERIEADARAAGMSGDGVRLRDGGSGVAAYADAVVTYLAMNIDRCAARWTHLAVWNNVGEKLEHIFRLNAFQMTWMHADGNPFSTSSGNWMGQLDWIRKCVDHFPASSGAVVHQRDARARVKESPGAVISTDPPYYDNVPYADLSDFYYVWLRKSLSEIWPDELATLSTPKAQELVADNQRLGSRHAAEQYFEAGMSEFMREVAASQCSGVPASIFYAYKATEARAGEVVSTGWDTFLQAIVDSGMVITATWPMRTEMPGGTRMVGRNVLSSSVVLACRPRPTGSPLGTRAEFVAALRQHMPQALHTLQSGNIAPVDLAQSAIGPGIRIFSQYSRVIEADGQSMPVRQALVIINDLVGETLDGTESELDPDSRFALTWYSQHGYGRGPFGDADLLCRAKNTSVAGVLESGVGILDSGEFRLLGRAELPQEWSPVTDGRLAVWEVTQHLVLTLERSESEAVELLQLLGDYAERARSLAYLLFKKATDQGWAEEAGAYNGLITAWPILHAASAGDSQQRMI